MTAVIRSFPPPWDAGDVMTKPPARAIPLLYLGTAHISLGLACVLAGVWPRAVAGFFYHSWMVAVVHLVTLGWITCSILGAIYIVGPVALRMTISAHRLDYAAYAFVLVGLTGMVAHFWIQEYGDMGDDDGGGRRLTWRASPLRAIRPSTTRFGNRSGAIGGAPLRTRSSSVGPGWRRIAAA